MAGRGARFVGRAPTASKKAILTLVELRHLDRRYLGRAHLVLRVNNQAAATEVIDDEETYFGYQYKFLCDPATSEGHVMQLGLQTTASDKPFVECSVSLASQWSGSKWVDIRDAGGRVGSVALEVRLADANPLEIRQFSRMAADGVVVVEDEASWRQQQLNLELADHPARKVSKEVEYLSSIPSLPLESIDIQKPPHNDETLTTKSSKDPSSHDDNSPIYTARTSLSLEVKDYASCPDTHRNTSPVKRLGTSSGGPPSPTRTAGRSTCSTPPRSSDDRLKEVMNGLQQMYAKLPADQGDIREQLRTLIERGSAEKELPPRQPALRRAPSPTPASAPATSRSHSSGPVATRARTRSRDRGDTREMPPVSPSSRPYDRRPRPVSPGRSLLNTDHLSRAELAVAANVRRTATSNRRSSLSPAPAYGRRNESPVVTPPYLSPKASRRMASAAAGLTAPPRMTARPVRSAAATRTSRVPPPPPTSVRTRTSRVPTMLRHVDPTTDPGESLTSIRSAPCARPGPRPLRPAGPTPTTIEATSLTIVKRLGGESNPSVSITSVSSAPVGGRAASRQGMRSISPRPTPSQTGLRQIGRLQPSDAHATPETHKAVRGRRPSAHQQVPARRSARCQAWQEDQQRRAVDDTASEATTTLSMCSDVGERRELFKMLMLKSNRADSYTHGLVNDKDLSFEALEEMVGMG